MNTKEGAESHTVLVTDIPVLEYGTIPHRIETTVFRYLPQRIKVRPFLTHCICQQLKEHAANTHLHADHSCLYRCAWPVQTRCAVLVGEDQEDCQGWLWTG